VATIPLGLYVHLPYCAKKCPYCDFNSHTAGPAMPRERYLAALLDDLRAEAARADGRELETVFIGGGTPSLFPPDDIAQVIETIYAVFRVRDDVEITMEANPGTVERGSPAGYRRAGVNRLSIGAQSFDDAKLERLGRLHSASDIRITFDSAVAAGFDNINIDVMHSLPGQTRRAALADLSAALDLKPSHLSWYQLTLEPNTVFFARPPEDLPDDDTTADIFDAGVERLAADGFEPYEVSAYARDGRRCRHNVNYWRFGDYLAAGAGAHGKITSPDGPLRYRKPENPLSFMTSIERGERLPGERVDESDRLFEFLLMASRLHDGFDVAQFQATTQLDSFSLETAMRAPIERGFIESPAPGRFRTTSLGKRFLNELQAGFLP